MADIFCDQAHTNNGDGDGWADQTGAGGAKNSLLNAGAASAAGDIIYVRNNSGTISAATIVLFPSVDSRNPVIVLGVKAATTNTPPTSSDLIPGTRTGDASPAYDQTGGNAAPILTTGSTFDLTVGGYAYIYGIKFQGGDDLILNNGDTNLVFEECLLEITGSDSNDNILVGGISANLTSFQKFINCNFKFGINTTQSVIFAGQRSGVLEFIGGKYTAATSAATTFVSFNQGGTMTFTGMDLSAIATRVVSGTGDGSIFLFKNCLIPSSVHTGTSSDAQYRIEFHNCSTTTGKSSGSLQNLDIITEAGDIVEETTAVRTGGADDGEAGLHSMAMTPEVNGTRDQYYSLIGPWMAFWVTNSDTAVDVFIANSGAADYNDDDVWLEVMDVSNGGTAQHTHLTTQMDLLATPSAITDDTGSTWGTGGNNHQKLSVTISPDFSGWSYCRVHFAKNFGSSPETLYVDPNPVTS